MKKNLLPVRDFKLAIAHTTLWMFAFWLVEYPLDDWAATAVILYVSLWLSRESVLALIYFVAKRLQGYARCVAQKAGAELRDDVPPADNFRDKLLSTALVLILCSTIIGLSLTIGIPVVNMYERTPLPFYFSWVAWGLLLGGGLGVLLMFGLVTWWLSSVEAEVEATIGYELARKVANRQPTELELKLLFLPLLFLFLLYHFHLQSKRGHRK